MDCMLILWIRTFSKEPVHNTIHKLFMSWSPLSSDMDVVTVATIGLPCAAASFDGDDKLTRCDEI